MTYQTTVTSKGQITIPKAFRDKLRLGKTRRVVVEMEATGKSLKVKPAPDFLEIAKNIKPSKQGKNILLSRESMEKHYKPR